jgi:glycosyltransferase involved in cell wall biosynthesis
MKMIAVYTSKKAVSLQKVAKTVCDVLAGEEIFCDFLEPSVIDLSPLSEYDGSLTVMPFDLAPCFTYFYTYWMWKQYTKKPSIFYTTIEGDVLNPHMYEWVKRDLDFVANSRYTEMKLKKHGYRVKEVIYHGIDLNLYDPSKYDEEAKKLREKLGFSQNDFVFLYVASSHPRKCHDKAAATMKILEKIDPSIKLVVLTDELATKYYKDVNNVLLLTDFGSIDEATMPALYKAVDAYAQFSCAEGFGLPVLEALAMGKLVVHVNYMPLTEITTPETSVRVKPIKRKYVEGGGSAILYEFYDYEAKDFAEAMIRAKELVSTDPSIADKARKRASEFDAYKLYKAFVKYFV